MKITPAIQSLIDQALAEDLGERGDITALAIRPRPYKAKATITAKEAGWIAGGPVAAAVFHTVQPRLKVQQLVCDGFQVQAGTPIMTIHGQAQDILTAERTALNFLGHLSGVATLTGKFVETIAHTRAKMLDTRKTLPGFRYLEKYAVRCGGGINHRQGLYDMFLIKENHIETAGGIAAAVNACRVYQKEKGFQAEIEVETNSWKQVAEALELDVDRIMLDNMSIAQMARCVAKVAGRVPLEASGNITLRRVKKVAETGVDTISAGSLTHSAPNLDLSLLLQICE
ncbi:MAG TPA: carboxylating nicotinate-nucleotide diphosphorylase [bacterium]|nr:carboxylating nicotinate-nucleotide diphosphorylase [bacterium]HNT66693.1 carboxylating nicotinate-nucleotide diphosphorylase [bacterium]HOX87014.1 carboxylating nicotinate-nucleotide diphosphorylase [bacterium]HPG46345.1 carboxylating nicotinate-nucleotide diphosphorylase [bacterium]HPM98461.1 carboxylating nicotinate-nucleotide diphosphorylase [bacterium]